MTDKKNPKTIRVSFRDNEFDGKLFDDIIEESKVIGQSAWMKLAAWEKLERDRNKVGATSTTRSNNPQILSLDQMMKKQ